MASEPTQAEILNRAISHALAGVFKSLPGTVVTYDPVRQVGNVQLAVKDPVVKNDGSVEFVDLPILPEVPFLWPRGGGYSLHLPMLPGDGVLLVFSDLDDTRWRETGAVMAPPFLQRHGLGYGWAIPGTFPALSPIATTDALPGMAILNGPAFLRLGGATATFVALAALVDAQFTALRAAITSAAGVEAGASGLGGMTALDTALTSAAWPVTTTATKVQAE